MLQNGFAVRFVSIAIPAVIAALSAHAAQVLYEYDDTGRLTKVIYPNTAQRSYTLDAAGNRSLVQTGIATGGVIAFVNESVNVAESAGSVQLTVRRTGNTTGAVTAAFATEDISATAGSDYTAASGTLSWVAGDASDKQINIVIRDDTSVESAEQLVVSLRSPTGGAQLGAIKHATLTLVSEDAPDTAAPSVPANLSARFASPSQVNLAWSAASDAGGSGLTGYVIFRDGVQRAVSTSTTFSDAVVNGTRHTYAVAAHDAAGNTSAQSSTATPPDTLPPTVPGTPTGSAVSSTQINLSWGTSTDAGGAGLDRYRLYRNGVVIATLTGTSFTDTALSPATTYVYTVDAYDLGGFASAASAPLSIATQAGAAIPAVPGNFVANGPLTNNRIDFSWLGSSGATRYELYETTSGAVLIYSGTATTFSATRGTGAIYEFYVRACSATGCSPESPTRQVIIDCRPVSCL